MSASEFANRLGYPRFGGQEDPLLRIANLPFKTILTTSPFTFVEDALRRAGKAPRTEVCRWSKDLVDTIPSVIDDRYEPSAAEPLIYHLHGLDRYVDALVLSEDDYLDYLGNLCEKQGDQSADHVPARVRVAGQEATVPGQCVEPVQLQVVCFQMWENLGKGEEGKEGKEGQEAEEITLEDLAVAGGCGPGADAVLRGDAGYSAGRPSRAGNQRAAGARLPSLALLLARQAVFATWPGDGYVTPFADAALQSAISRAERLGWVMNLPRHRHSGGVWSAAYSPDGAQAAGRCRRESAGTRIWIDGDR